jgi:predicted amidophosphoribosyltransferase
MMAKLGSKPQILCWNCRKLTPFEIEHCEHCGSAFAGSTGGAYSSAVPAVSRPKSVREASLSPRKRSLSEIVDDLARVHELSLPTAKRPREQDVSVHLYQCPSCGRFVSERATDCACGVRFAPMSDVTFLCPECASRVPSDKDSCPVCAVEFEAVSPGNSYVYACPRCGSHVTSDAVRCSCGAWFED